MSARECPSGSWTRIVPSPVQCRDGAAGSRVFVGGLNKGRAQPISVQGPRTGLRSLCCGIQYGKDLDWFSAATEKWPQESVLGALTRAGPRLVPCSV